ncbi:MAG: hypothetical protein ACR2PX_20910 [Endozoicomonas sp.]|uniref:hypothetical protein n=1 Tax=Endozoicomonas sp. TaxID=1892382 RepID=UPI003D9B96B9
MKMRSGLKICFLLMLSVLSVSGHSNPVKNFNDLKKKLFSGFTTNAVLSTEECTVTDPLKGDTVSPVTYLSINSTDWIHKKYEDNQEAIFFLKKQSFFSHKQSNQLTTQLAFKNNGKIILTFGIGEHSEFFSRLVCYWKDLTVKVENNTSADYLSCMEDNESN